MENKSPTFNREANGLVSGVTYQFNPDGTVNWRKMIKPEFLVPNEERLSAQQLENLSTLNVQDLKDEQVLILLGGIKELAFLRGFTSVNYQVHAATREYICVQCNIMWMPHFETQNYCVSSSALADAHVDNTNRMGLDFLASIAENRAFVRAVRNFLRINIVGKDEMKNRREATENINSINQSTSSSGPAVLDEYGFLSDLLEKKSITFDKVRARLVREGVESADTFQTVKDIPAPEVYKLIEALKKLK